MSRDEAIQYVDLVVDTLLEEGVVTPEAYGRMPEELRSTLADKVAAKSEE